MWQVMSWAEKVTTAFLTSFTASSQKSNAGQPKQEKEWEIQYFSVEE